MYIDHRHPKRLNLSGPYSIPILSERYELNTFFSLKMKNDSSMRIKALTV